MNRSTRRIQPRLADRNRSQQRFVGAALGVEHFEKARITGFVADLRQFERLLRRPDAPLLRLFALGVLAQPDQRVVATSLNAVCTVFWYPASACRCRRWPWSMRAALRPASKIGIAAAPGQRPGTCGAAEQVGERPRSRCRLPVSDKVGNSAALATPICALAEISVSSA